MFPPDPIAVVVFLVGIGFAMVAAIGFGVAICRGTRAEHRRGLQ